MSLSCMILTRTRSRFDTFNTRRPVRRKSQVCVLIRHFSPLFRISFHRCATIRFADVLHFVSRDTRLLKLTNRSIPLKNRTLLVDYKILQFLRLHRGERNVSKAMVQRRKIKGYWYGNRFHWPSTSRKIECSLSIATCIILSRGLYKSIFIVNATLSLSLLFNP